MWWRKLRLRKLKKLRKVGFKNEVDKTSYPSLENASFG